MNRRSALPFALSLLVLIPLFSGCNQATDSAGSTAVTPSEAVVTPSPSSAEPAASVPDEAALAAYSAFLSGDRSLLGDAQLETWWIPAFSGYYFPYEYTYLDLDGDGSPELLVQMENDPGSYNGVFHFDGERLQCWSSDGIEMSCRDYPLLDGTMVHQYDTGEGHSYHIFRYRSDGGQEDIHDLFAREELPYEDSTLPCPYYEVDGVEVDEAEFEAQLDRLVESNLLDRSCWTTVETSVLPPAP